MLKRAIAILLAGMMLLCAAAALGEENAIVGRGDSGEKVIWIQQRLKDLNYLDREPTGTFDEETERALMAFQRDHGLLESGMADGITLSELETAERRAEPESMKWLYDALTEETEVYEGGAWEMPAAYVNYSMAAGAMRETNGWEFSTDEYTAIRSNGFVSTAASPLSTFAADVDTSAYAQFRRRVLDGSGIPADSIRVEEILNYFRYDYKQPEGSDPFGVTIECAPCPWNEETRLLLIGLQAREVKQEERPGHNLVFLIDTSGSMEGADRLDLVKRAFLLLLEELNPEDTVSIVTYASLDRVVIEGVRAGEKTRIMEAISELEAGGSTNGSAGILRAYEIAEKYRIQGGVNRILLATDGDLNVGTTSEGELARMVSEKKKSGISLTCLGFGMGNYKDNKMEALADYGDGNCWYIDTIYEARKALVTEGGGTFMTLAKDVKLQVDFNRAAVRGYRLIGYEDRLMAAEDFADDGKDGGEIGSGHRMTALYEIVPADSAFDFGETGSRYAAENNQAGAEEWLTLSIRAKEPEGSESRLYEYTAGSEMLTEEADDNMKFAAAAAEVCMVLRDSEWKGSASFGSALALLRDCKSISGDPYKEEFVYLVTLLERAQEVQP